MEQTTKFLIIGMAAVFAMILAPALNAAPAAAQPSTWDRDCIKKNSISERDCTGNSINSPNKESAAQNPGGNYPKGHIEEGRK